MFIGKLAVGYTEPMRTSAIFTTAHSTYDLRKSEQQWKPYVIVTKNSLSSISLSDTKTEWGK